jgi:hypothetical protein
MLLIDPTEAALAIGAKCNGQQPADNEQLILVLNYITPRVEDALNVATLVRGDFVDSFYLTGMNARSERPIARLRLSNGFLTEESDIAITDLDGEPIDAETIELYDLEHGVIELNSWEKGRYSVAYKSGFLPEEEPTTPPEGYDPNHRLLTEVPDWIKGLVITLLVQWFRSTMLAPKFPQNVNLEALDRMLRKEIYLRVYGRYMRPRVNCFFSERLSNGA